MAAGFISVWVAWARGFATASAGDGDTVSVDGAGAMYGGSEVGLAKECVVKESEVEGFSGETGVSGSGAACRKAYSFESMGGLEGGLCAGSPTGLRASSIWSASL